MHILLVGPGALGCLLAATLSRAMTGTGHRLTMLDHNQERADFLTRQGILCDTEDQRQRLPISVTAKPAAMEDVEATILCVKSYDISTTLQFCQPLLKKGVLLLFLQNGIAHLACHHLTGSAAIAFGTTTEGATLLATGHVRHAGHGQTSFGLPGPGEALSIAQLNRLAEIFTDAGLPTTVADGIVDRLWAKLFVNVGTNALTAIHGCANGELLAIPDAVARMRAAVAEAEKIARARGIRIADPPFDATLEVCRKTTGNISSMLQDIRRRRRTEIDAINGAIVNAGRELGIDTPENLRLFRQVKEIEAAFEASHDCSTT